MIKSHNGHLAIDVDNDRVEHVTALFNDMQAVADKHRELGARASEFMLCLEILLVAYFNASNQTTVEALDSFMSHASNMANLIRTGVGR